MVFKVPEQCRIRIGRMGSDASYGNNGAFFIRLTARRMPPMFCIASDGEGWEHVSVSIPSAARCPTWEEMCAVKDMFWAAEDEVVQFHPPKSEYVNAHRFCLHLWRSTQFEIPRPPSILVGPKATEPA